MNTYEHYKESGIEWIGQIPEHWEVSKVKNYLEIPITDGPHTTPILLDEGIPFISAEAIKNGKIDFSKKRGNISEEDYQIFSQKYLPKRNDIYMIKSGATTGNIAMVETDEIFTIWSPLAVFRSGKKILPRFLYNVLSSGYFRRGVELNWSFGTQQNIGMGILANLFITLPPIHEQKAIAKFLDDKTAKIDALVQTKEQQIEKLKELRQAKIHQAVTKGLDTNAPTKDSGVEWIGEIPAHWEVKKVKQLAYIKSGEAITNSQLKEIGKYEVFGGNGLMGYYDKYNVKGKSLIIGRVGALCGNVRYIEDKKWISDNALILKLTDENYYRFLFISLTAGDLNKLNASNAQPLITGTKVLNFSISFPPIQEQEQIVAYLDEVTGKIDQAITQKQEQIAKLKEYKQSLINDVVTGKVRVC